MCLFWPSHLQALYHPHALQLSIKSLLIDLRHIESDRSERNTAGRCISVLQTGPFNQQEGKRGNGNNSFPSTATEFHNDDCSLSAGKSNR